MPYKRTDSNKWWIIVKGVRQSSGTEAFEDAEALENRLNLEHWQADRMGVKLPRSWQEAVVKYLHENRHQRAYDSTVQRLRWWDDHLRGVRDLRSINRDMIDKVITKHRTVSATPVSANTTSNKYTGVVAAVLNAACKEWEWIEVVPKFRKYPQPSHRTCWLRLEDWRSLEAELPSHLLLPARFALATGLRASKVFGLEWSQIDMPYRSMTHTGVHNKRGNTIPLNDTAMSVINEIKGGPFVHMSRVFTYKGRPLNDYGKAWYKALERAGIEDFPWHGFRHTFASWLGQSGAPDGVLDQLCGWAEKDTRGVYSHLDVEPLRMYSSVIDKKLAGRSVQFLHGKVFGEQPLTSEAM